MYCKYSQSTVIRKNLNVVRAVRSALSLRNGDTVGVVCVSNFGNGAKNPFMESYSKFDESVISYMYRNGKEEGCVSSRGRLLDLCSRHRDMGVGKMFRGPIYVCIERTGEQPLVRNIEIYPLSSVGELPILGAST